MLPNNWAVGDELDRRKKRKTSMIFCEFNSRCRPNSGPQFTNNQSFYAQTFLSNNELKNTATNN
ncbi:hypothetical protein BX666DRAFT_1184047 [Dichotomocladium elegans]|nr:hypothetical protein BX666DRAFT_1184047 [Dichotomocladium elegans]